MGDLLKQRAMFLKRIHCGLLAGCIALAAMIGNSSVHAEKWTSLSGERTIEAKMVGMWEDGVVLLLPDGRRVSVPMNSLNAVSRIQAGDLAEKRKRSRAALAEELQQAAAAQAAPAPDPLPTPAEPPPYAPPQANMTPDQAIDAIAQQIRDGHLVVIYDALPPSFRKQIDDLVRLTTIKLSPQAWSESLGQLHRIADLIVTRQNWVLSHPKLHDPLGQSEELTVQGAAIQNFAIPLAGLVRAAVPADAIALDQIRDTGFGTWLHQRDAAIAPYLAELMQRYSAPGAAWLLASSTENTAILAQPSLAPSTANSGSQGSASGRSSEISIALKLVDGFWIPAAIADGFNDWVQEQTAALEAHEDGQMSLSDWLGGTFAIAPTAPVAAKRDEYGMESGGSPNSSEYETNSFETNSYETESYETSMSYEMDDSFESDGFAVPRGVPAKMIEPSAITPELVGTILQSIDAYGSMIQPLESAADAAAFHQAADQLIAPIQAVLSLLAPRS